MSKVVWIALPLLVYGGWVAFSSLRRRAPTKRALNVHTSLMLMIYLLITAGLGVFWVANQQLPVFDWHYLFGYATVALVSVHLVFNLPVAWRFLRGKRSGTGSPEARRLGRPAMRWALAVAGTAVAAFLLGMRHGASELRLEWGPDGPGTALGSVQAVVRYHEFASASRMGLLARAPAVDWGPKPPPYKRYPKAESVALPAPTADTSRPLSDAVRGPGHAVALDLKMVSTMLHHTAGITDERAGYELRAAPSSGALFPTEVYLVARRVEGLTVGLYHYQPREHHLERLSDAPSALALGAQGALADAAPMTVVLTSIFRRTGHKYRDRAYRYAIADAGHLLENLRLAAGEAGLSAHALDPFDESRAAKALRVDGVEEGVVAMVALDATPAHTLGRAPFRVTEAPKDDGPIGVTGMVHLATSMRLEAGAGETLALPPATASDDHVLATIARRRSKRRFTTDPVTLATLSSLLFDAHQPPLLSPAVHTQLVINRVDGLEQGVYRYRSEHHALEVVRRGDFADAARTAALSQDVIGDAAVVFVLSAERTPMFRQGARGYRHAFLETGMIGERLLLGAVARGLGACPVGAFYDGDAANLIGVEQAREWALHFVGLGVVDE